MRLSYDVPGGLRVEVTPGAAAAGFVADPVNWSVPAGFATPRRRNSASPRSFVTRDPDALQELADAIRQSEFGGDEYFLAGHRVDGRRMLPGEARQCLRRQHRALDR